MLSVFMDLLSKYEADESDMRKVILVWAVRDGAQAKWFEKTWAALAESKTATKEIFQVRQYITVPVLGTKNPIDTEDGGNATMLDVRSGRPSIPDTLEEMKRAFEADGEGSSGAPPGVAVLACGPGGLMNEVHDETFAAQSPQCRFSLHKETFLL